MLERITTPIHHVDEGVSFVPKPPHYFTISRDQQHGGLICSYSGCFKKEGELPLHYSEINASLPSQEPLDKLIPLYHYLKAERDKHNQNPSEK